MKFSILGFIPVPVYYVDEIPNHMDGSVTLGRAYCFYFKIRKDRKTDIPLHYHELQHVKQCYRGLFIFHRLLGILSENYNLYVEAEAFAAQLKHMPVEDRERMFERFTDNIYNWYELPHSRPEIRNKFMEICIEMGVF